MCCENYWKRIVSFTIAATLGVFITGIFQKISYNNKTPFVPPAPVLEEAPTKPVSCGNGLKIPPETKPLQIFSKPRPAYTDAARQNEVTGAVRLRVTFLASGQVGSVTPISGLSYGLTEQAIAAARNIKFEPAKENGKPVTVVKTVEYNFSIY